MKRVPQKHLITIEPALSVGTTEEMEKSHLQLIVPYGLHAGYTANQKSWLMSVSDFICLAASRQNL
ncbi:MAG: hypothetical protein KGZ61_05705 [Sandarakinorhabdus sp.]|nr:hypothetical protein [Sandarakinorhabdus sp.]